MSTTPRPAAAVVLLRDTPLGCEALLVRRRAKASFMANAFVFPGGAADDGEADSRITAARELLEEAAIRVSPDALIPFARWITPSIEPKRFSARFFLAALPPDQEPRADGDEVIELTWLAPKDAAARAGELRLPPPQLFTMHELSAARDTAGALAFAASRASWIPTIQPRFLPASAPTLLLPWDPEYASHGTGDAAEIAADHPITANPSRFVLGPGGWRLTGVAAPE